MPVTPDAAAAFLCAREADARGAREQRAAEVRLRVLSIIRRSLPAGARAWLVGSLAWGGFGEGSDVDVVLRGAPPGAETDLELMLAEELRLAADVLRFEDLPEAFRVRVEREGVVVDGS